MRSVMITIGLTRLRLSTVDCIAASSTTIIFRYFIKTMLIGNQPTVHCWLANQHRFNKIPKYNGLAVFRSARVSRAFSVGTQTAL
jgi:hypothetical protein